MAAPIRHSSTVLLRRATFPRSASSLARCFTTMTASLADNRNQNDSPRARVNPLIGGIFSTLSRKSAPALRRPAPTANASEAPKPPSPPSSSPPPPPPPMSSNYTDGAKFSPRYTLVSKSTAAAADNDAATSSSSSPKYAYDATTSGLSGFSPDIASMVSLKAAVYSLERPQCDPMERPLVRTAAATGRTVFLRPPTVSGFLQRVNSAPTLPAALSMLNRIARDQHIKNKWHSQRRHERRGVKRKRLRAIRKAARFKTSFCAAYARVNELRQMGW